MCRSLKIAIAVLLVYLCGCLAAYAGDRVVLNSGTVAATVDVGTASVVGIDNLTSGESRPVTCDVCRLVTSRGVIDLGAGKWKLVSTKHGEYSFVTNTGGIEAKRVYRVHPGAGYFDRSLTVTNRSGSDIVLKKVTDADLQFTTPFVSASFHDDNTKFSNSINVFLRDPKGTLCVGLKYPYFKPNLSDNHVSLWYEPNYRLKAGEELELPAVFCVACMRTGYKCRKDMGDFQPPDVLTSKQEVMDITEVRAMQNVVEDYVVREPLPVSGYVIAFDAWWGRHELDKKVGDTEVGIYGKLIHQVKQADCIDILCPAACWIGMYSYGYACPEICAVGDDAVYPINSNIRRVVDNIKSAGLPLACYCEGNMNAGGYRQDKPEWKWQPVSDPGKRSIRNCQANPQYSDWFFRLICNTIDTCGLSRWSWDDSWFNCPAVCYDPSHGHEFGNIEFQQYKNITGIIQKLRTRYPKMQMCAFWGLKEGNPWSLRGINSQENFYENSSWSGINRGYGDDLRFQHWYNHNYRFLPTYMDMAQLNYGKEMKGHLYSVLSCLSASTHASICDWMPFETQEEADKIYGPTRQWKKWASDHIKYLRDRIDLFGQPCRNDGIDGTAHIIEDRGYIFVFNPTKDSHWGEIPVNELIGLRKGSRFSLDEISSGTAKRMGVYNLGDRFEFRMEPNSAMLIEMKPSTEQTSETKAPAGEPVQSAFNE